MGKVNSCNFFVDDVDVEMNDTLMNNKALSYKKCSLITVVPWSFPMYVSLGLNAWNRDFVKIK